MKNVLLDEYFNWLVAHVSGDTRYPVEQYEFLLSYLHSLEFRWLITNDKNRAIDGNSYRDIFANGDDEISHILASNLPYPCSILEMLIAMSIRCEFDIMHDPGGGDNSPVWFWTMIDNLHLSFYTDDRWDEDTVSYILWRWLDREYESNGEGGLFPLVYPIEDCRNVEIWGLLNRWISENYEY